MSNPVINYTTEPQYHIDFKGNEYEIPKTVMEVEAPPETGAIQNQNSSL